MATPTNSSGKLRVSAGSGNQTFNAGFTLTAGRQAVCCISGYAGGNSITGITIGGTAATKIAGSTGTDYAEIWAVTGAGMTGGTTDVVVSVTGGSTDVYLTLAVDEWAASSLTYDTGTANNGAHTNTNAPSISTAGAVSTTSSIVYACINMFGLSSSCTPTQPTGWTSMYAESDGTTYEMGMGAWHEETTTGIKTALFSLSANNDVKDAIGAFILAGAGSNTISVPLATMSLDAKVPTVVTTGNQTVAVPLATISLDAKVPTVVATATVTSYDVDGGSRPRPGRGPFSTGKFFMATPEAMTTANQTVSVPLASITLDAFAPTVTVGANQAIAVPLATISLDGQAPTVTVTAHNLISVPVASMTLDAQTPTVVTTGNNVISVPTASISLDRYAPTVIATGNPVFPDPADVRTGITYGPNGNDYTGTLEGGGSVYVRRR